NHQFALMIWLVNLVIGIALLFFTWRFLLAPPVPTMPSYVPVYDQLPDFTPQSKGDWESIAWTRKTDTSNQRAITQRRFARLFMVEIDDSSDWSQRISVPVPARKPEIVKPVPPEEKPTLAEAQADLEKKVSVRVFMGPARVIVVLNSAPNDEYTLVNPEEWNAFVAEITREPGPGGTPRDPVKFSGRMLNDMRSVGLPMRVVRIEPTRWTVTYDYKGTTFEIPLNPPQTPGRLDGGTETAAQSFLDTMGGAGVSGTPVKPGPTGTRPTNPTPTPPVNPDANREESYELSPDVWQLVPKELDNLQTNMSSLIEELKPKSVYNPEKREYEGIEMSNVPEESLAYKRGFRPKDVIISINGVTVRSVTDVKNYVRNNKNLPQYVVVFERNGARQTRTFRTPSK
ncbi:MAG: PDZ domain-containing protein, partial [Planctomycetota bacterium]